MILFFFYELLKKATKDCRTVNDAGANGLKSRKVSTSACWFPIVFYFIFYLQNTAGHVAHAGAAGYNIDTRTMHN